MTSLRTIASDAFSQTSNDNSERTSPQTKKMDFFSSTDWQNPGDSSLRTNI